MAKDESRQELLMAFAAEHGWGGADVYSLPADASARSYHRLSLGGKTVMLMDAPPATESLDDFVRMADHLARMGLSTPDLLQRDMEQGFLLLEDFGEGTFTKILEDGGDPAPLYQMAVDVLVRLHGDSRSTGIVMPPYDEAFTLMEVGLLADWYWPEKKGSPCPAAVRADYIRAWQDVYAARPMMAPELVIRDFHVDNLMLLPGRDGVRACGILDFQSALIGQPPYDLMSLLEDARRDVPAELQQAMLNRYFASRPGLDRSLFEHWYAVLGAQRHAKILGGFMRTWRRDGKDGYLKFMPRVARQLSAKLALPALAPVAGWFETHLPHIPEGKC